MLEYLLLKYYSIIKINLFQSDPVNQIIGCEKSRGINLHNSSVRKKVAQWEAPERVSSPLRFTPQIRLHGFVESSLNIN